MKKLVFLLASMLTLANTAFGQIGSLSTDLVFVPVTPCRVFDTRVSQGGTGPIATHGTKNFLVSNTPSYAAQGGSPTNCGLSTQTNLAAAAINLTVVSGGMGGYITAFPLGSAKPLAATVNYGENDVRGNMAIVKVSQTGGEDLSIYANQQTEVIGDVVGYYTRPVATPLDCYTTPEATISVAAGDFGSASAVACAATYYSFPTGCYSDGTDFVAVPNTFACVLKNTGTTTQTMKYNRRCCRIPGR